MNLVIFGLTVSSAWGNGHATLWRGLLRALGARGHQIAFFERDVPYYASHRDLTSLPDGRLVLYESWSAVRGEAEAAIAAADAALVTSYCPDARAATDLLREAACLRGFYDLDTPVTLSRLARGDAVEYLPSDGLRAFDVVLSYTGGPALDALRTRLGARRVAPLYGSADPDVHRPGRPRAAFAAECSYLGTYAPDRQDGVERLLLGVARARPDRQYLVGGSLYPADIVWPANVRRLAHVDPSDHPDFYASSSFTLNVTRAAMAGMGYCPSGRLFEAAACGAAIISDAWDGLETFFEPGREIRLAASTDDVLGALAMPASERRAMGEAARARVLACHTAEVRAATLERILTARPVALRNSAAVPAVVEQQGRAVMAEPNGRHDRAGSPPRTPGDRADPAVPPQRPDAPTGEVGSEGGSEGNLLETPDVEPRPPEGGKRAPARRPETDA